MRLINALREFLRLSNGFWDFYFETIHSIPQERFQSPARDEIIKAFIKRGGNAFTSGLETTYKQIREQMDALLS